MTYRTTIRILIIPALLYSCKDTTRDDKYFEEQANKNIRLLDTSALRFLESWDYGQRGEIHFWS
jgi:hypothetical protein